MISIILRYFLKWAMKRDKIFVNVWQNGNVRTYSPDVVFGNKYSVDISIVIDKSMELDLNGRPKWLPNCIVC